MFKLNRSFWIGAAVVVAAIGLYYWFGAVAVQTSWELPPGTTPLIRVLAFGLITYWFVTSVRRSGDPGPRHA